MLCVPCVTLDVVEMGNEVSYDTAVLTSECLLVYRVCGGGTGSGLGHLLLERLSVDCNLASRCGLSAN